MKLIELFEMYDIHTIICDSYICSQSNINDFLHCVSNDLLKFVTYTWYSKLHVLVYEVIDDETK